MYCGFGQESIVPIHYSFFSLRHFIDKVRSQCSPRLVTLGVPVLTRRNAVAWTARIIIAYGRKLNCQDRPIKWVFSPEKPYKI